MISRLLSIIILLLVGIGVLLYLFSDDLLKKGEETATQAQQHVEKTVKEAQSTMQEKKEQTQEAIMRQMQEVLDKAEAAVKETVVQ